jgi:zinc protease
VETVLREELGKLRSEPPSLRELGRAVNQIESSFLDRLERSGGFYGKADLLNAYFVRTGNPDYFEEDLSRYRALDPGDLQAAAQEFLGEKGAVVLNVVPKGQKGLASGNGKEVSFK